MKTYNSRSKKDKDIVYKFPPFPLRPYQAEVLQTKKLRICLNWGRRTGKDVTAWAFIIMKALTQRGKYWYCLLDAKQAVRNVWEAPVHVYDENDVLTVYSFLDFLPPGSFDQIRKKDNTIFFKNGSILRMMGGCSGTVNHSGYGGSGSKRGVGLSGVVLSEYAFFRGEDFWIKTIEPTLRTSRGFAVFISTPNPGSHWDKLCKTAKNNPDTWYFSRKPSVDAGVVKMEELQRQMDNGELSKREVYVEYLLESNYPAEGAILGQHMFQLELLPNLHVPGQSVYTAWDLGINDPMAVIYFQVDYHGSQHTFDNIRQIRIIDFYKSNVKTLGEIIEDMDKKPYLYDRHYLPHDVVKRETQLDGSICTRLEIFNNLFKLRAGMGETKKLPKLHVATGNEYCVQLLKKDKIKFDVKAEELFIDLLAYNGQGKDAGREHSADAFRYMATAVSCDRLSPEERILNKNWTKYPVSRYTQAQVVRPTPARQPTRRV